LFHRRVFSFRLDLFVVRSLSPGAWRSEGGDRRIACGDRFLSAFYTVLGPPFFPTDFLFSRALLETPPCLQTGSGLPFFSRFFRLFCFPVFKARTTFSDCHSSESLGLLVPPSTLSLTLPSQLGPPWVVPFTKRKGPSRFFCFHGL